MSIAPLLPVLATGVVLCPLLALLVVGGSLLLGLHLNERTVANVTAVALGMSLLLAASLLVGMVIHGDNQVVVYLGQWFSMGGYGFEATLLLDRLSLPFVLLTCALTGLVGRFSAAYLHRDEGFFRFYLLLLLFTSAMLLLVTAGGIDLLFAGWEIVGVSSALLIAFFNRRKEPAVRGLRAFAVYRVCDVGLLVAAVLIEHETHSPQFEVMFEHSHWPGGETRLSGGITTVVALLLVLAAMGKSAQVPFSSWLPRAMEGPTPSSAIFYGGLSIHAGAYLLLRTSPVLDQAPLAATALVAVGLCTAVYATMVGRVQVDAKNQLAYASMTQVGLILAEIGLGLRMLALVHIAGHATLRTLQFLRAPSLLHEQHRIDAAAGGELAPTGVFYERLLPSPLRRWLYAIALNRGGLDDALERCVTGPLLGVARVLERLEQRWVSRFAVQGAAPRASAEQPDRGELTASTQAAPSSRERRSPPGPVGSGGHHYRPSASPAAFFGGHTYRSPSTFGAFSGTYSRRSLMAADSTTDSERSPTMSASDWASPPLLTRRRKGRK